MSDSLLTQEQIRRVEDYLDREANHQRFEEQGLLVYQVFREDRGGRDNVSSQARNRRRVATSAARLSDVEDFIKNQMGKGSGAAKRWRQQGLGETLLDELKTLRKAAAEWAGGDS